MIQDVEIAAVAGLAGFDPSSTSSPPAAETGV